ncbi:MAG: hypothetical protein HEP71_02800 [Roseivirga sp.]|nr:hypothetical protein [Roseivirga sp.]
MDNILSQLTRDFELDTFFKRFVRQFDNDETFANKLWVELHEAYTAKGRHYHNLSHLVHMIEETTTVLSQINDLDTLLCSIFYHDIIYSVKRQDNEEKSADLGIQRALDIGLGVESAKLCHKQILATKSHSLSDDRDTNYLCDIDLSVLGAKPEVYQNYTVAIRKEYSIYPGFLYKKGRRKVLKHFLEMDYIFKTELFREKYEEKALKNLQAELKTLYR